MGVGLPQARTPGIASLAPSSPNSLAGLWGSSWTTLQGIASDFLGNDVESVSVKGNPKRAPGKQYGRRIASAESALARAPGEWGPAGPTSVPATSDIGSGTKGEREAALRAQKRKDMLLRQESSYADARGKFKRRLSDDHESMSAPPGENDNRAALVYIHHVKKDDTLAGITIKYNCSANVLRKANRMWPNDTVQVRQIIVLPVDACGVKGKPVPDPEALDLLSAESESDALSAGQAEEVPPPSPSLPNGDNTTRDRTSSLSTTSTSRRAFSSIAPDTATPWHHSSWVLLPHTPHPTEIARLPRQALGYFPPARRKSNTLSTRTTPSTSLDIRRTSMNPNPHSPQRQNPPRARRSSNAGTGYFPSYLAGPGGVGTMARNVHTPGPAQDGLNKFFAKHLPDVAPPAGNQRDLLRLDVPLYSDEEGTPVGSGVVTPSYPSGGGEWGWGGRVGERGRGD